VQRANVVYSRLGGVMSGNPPRFKFSAGGIIRTGHLKDINAFTKYQGHEYHRIGIEELTLIPFEDDYLKLISSCRSTIKDLQPQVFSTTNPGGPGHSWVKTRFVDNGSGKTFIDPETSRSRIFISATIDDNPTLINADPEYVRFLDGLQNKDPNLYKAWRLGSWEIFAGQAFSMLSRSTHIIKPVEIQLPKYFAGYDYGYAHPFAFVLLCVDASGEISVVDYVSKTRCEVEEQGRLINELVGDKRMDVYSGVDAWNKEGGPTIVSRLRNTCPKLNFIKANTNRVQGVAELRKWLFEERLKFFSNATPVFEQLLSVQHDPKKPEDVLKMNADDNGDNGDDLFDACFPSFTRVKTEGGDIKINKIEVGDRVFTSQGLKQVKNAWCSGFKKVNILITNKGRVLFATPNHPIKSGADYVRLDALRYGDTIQTWQQSPIEATSLETTPTPKESTCKDTTTPVGTTKKGVLRYSTEKSTNTKTDQFQRDTTFTTKTETGKTINQTTWLQSLLPNIWQSTADPWQNYKNILRKLDHLLLSGTNQKKAEYGTANTQRTSTKTVKNNPIGVNSVTQNIQPNMWETIYSVLTNVGQSLAEIVVWMIYLVTVCIAKLSFLLISILKPSSAPEAVLVNITTPLKTRVFNLEVSYPEYYANGVLVHNCRYAVLTWIYPNTPVKKILPNTKEDMLQWVEKRKRLREFEYDVS